jgi:tetratricopeptide (TPR) repeat protein
MIAARDISFDFPVATAGEIAVINLESARERSWSRFWQSPHRQGIAEHIVEQEQMSLQFLSDFGALDRLVLLVNQLVHADAEPARIALIQAQVASTTHRFAEARGCLETVEMDGTLREAASRVLLSIDQACGYRLDAVLKTRKQMAAESGRLEDLVPLGALLADLRSFDQADTIYRSALTEYRDVSPFALAWTCFQLGSLWGELVPEIQPDRAEQWYRKAIDYVPSYVKARVHLSEILLGDGRFEDAQALLSPVSSSDDPEVNWRLADVMAAMGNHNEAALQMQIARSGFENLLQKHLLAFADHGAEFYSGSGKDAERAFELARMNLQNRPTLRAFEQAYEIGVESGKSAESAEILLAAGERWGTTPAFELYILDVHFHEFAGRARSRGEQPHGFQS